VKFVIHYGDNFSLVRSAECARALAVVKQAFSRLGLPIATDKLEGSSHCLTFLGIEIDITAMEIRLLLGKLQDLKELLSTWLGGRQSCTRMELESHIGKLGHACKVVRPGKTFMRHGRHS
jgi:hypothetical protein